MLERLVDGEGELLVPDASYRKNKFLVVKDCVSNLVENGRRGVDFIYSTAVWSANLESLIGLGITSMDAAEDFGDVPPTEKQLQVGLFISSDFVNGFKMYIYLNHENYRSLILGYEGIKFVVSAFMNKGIGPLQDFLKDEGADSAKFKKKN